MWSLSLFSRWCQFGLECCAAQALQVDYGRYMAEPRRAQQSASVLRHPGTGEKAIIPHLVITTLNPIHDELF